MGEGFLGKSVLPKKGDGEKSVWRAETVDRMCDGQFYEYHGIKTSLKLTHIAILGFINDDNLHALASSPILC